MRISHVIPLMVLPLLISCATRPGPGEVRTVQSPPATAPVSNGTVGLSFAGTFGPSPEIRAPRGISFGVDGTLYICDRGKSSVIRLDENGKIISVFDSFTNRTERLYAPIDVCSSSGIEVYAVDQTRPRILRFDRNLLNGYTIYRAGDADMSLFGSFNGIAYDAVSGDMYITDRDSGTVIRVDMLGTSVRTFGGFGSQKKSLEKPAGLDVDRDGILYVADTSAGAVAVIENFSRFTYIGTDVLEAPQDATVLPGGYIAVADRSGIVILSRSGEAAATAGFNTTPAMTPYSCAYRDGRLYVSDTASASILVFEITLPQ